MKYSDEITIKLSLARAVELYDNQENLHKWMPTLRSFNHYQGTYGESGAKSNMVFETGKRRIEMVETIVERNLPEVFSAIYEANNVWNKVSNKFVPTADGNTRWELESEFKFRGVLRLVALLMPGAFKKQTRKNMEQFRDFAEAEGELAVAVS